MADDPGWAAFAPRIPKPPSLIERGADRVIDAIERTIRHEWFRAAAGSVLLAMAMLGPALRDPTRVLPGGLAEPAARAWQLAWLGHALATDPAAFARPNAYHGESVGYLATAPLLGYAPLGLIGSGPAGAVLGYNIAFVLAFALATFGGYALIRQLGAGRVASCVAAIGLAYAPWRLGQIEHLDAISTGGITLALAMLARGHGWSMARSRRGPRRPAWAVAGWLIAAWQLSLSPSVAVPFGYALVAGCLAAGLAWLVSGRRRVPVRLLAADLCGAALTGAAATGLAYLHNRATSGQPGLKVSRDVLALSSPPWRGLLTAPEQSLLWGGSHEASRSALRWPPGMAVLPGYFLCALALAGLVVSLWTVAQRLVLLLGVITTGVLAMGTSGPGHGRLGYLQLFWNLPGFASIRAPSWLIGWTTLLLAVLAAGALSRLAGWARATTQTMRPGRARVAARWLLRLAVCLLVAPMVVEGLPAIRTATVPAVPSAAREAFRQTGRSPVLVLPTSPALDPQVMLWSTAGFVPVVNGGPDALARLVEVRRAVREFPDRSSVELLRDLGVRTVVVLRKPAVKAGYAAATEATVDETITEFGLTVQERPDVIVYTLD